VQFAQLERFKLWLKERRISHAYHLHSVRGEVGLCHPEDIVHRDGGDAVAVPIEVVVAKPKY